MGTFVYSLRDARAARGKQLADAKREFERACQRAAAVAATRKRNADRGWESARQQAHKIAVLRRRIWQEISQVDSQELTLRLAIHESRLSPQYRPRITGDKRADETWYVRMTRSELRRRGVLDDPALEARRAADLAYGQLKIQALIRFEEAS
jgi:hypothetical protein